MFDQGKWTLKVLLAIGVAVFALWSDRQPAFSVTPVAPDKQPNTMVADLKDKLLMVGVAAEATHTKATFSTFDYLIIPTLVK